MPQSSPSGSPRGATRMHAPLPRLALCLDCDEAFEIGETCPACGSKTWLPLAGFLERGGARAPARPRSELGEPTRHLLVIAQNRIDLFDPLRRAFAGQQAVRLILDRRKDDRRRTSEPALTERRRRDRRQRSDVDEQLRTHGCALVPFSVEAVRRFAAR